MMSIKEVGDNICKIISGYF